MRRLFLDEFYNAPEVGIGAIAEELTRVDPMVDLQRAEGLYDRVFSQYGDDSVAQLGGAHLAVEQKHDRTNRGDRQKQRSGDPDQTPNPASQ